MPRKASTAAAPVVSGAWPAEQVEMRAIAGLIPYAQNARMHSATQIDQIAASIREWGWTVPILVDETGLIIAGHGRVLAAQKLAIAAVPVMVAVGWSAEQVKAYRLADNQLTIAAKWDDGLLSAELLGLQASNFDLGLLAFGADELRRYLAMGGTLGLTDPDDVPEVPAEPVSRLGDVWLLGRHRLMCGDSTNADDVAKALSGAVPHLMVTDPPYGVSYDAGWRQAAGFGGAARGKVLNDDRADWREAWALFPGDVAYVWHGSLHHVEVTESLAACGFGVRSQIVWVKTRPVISRGHYHHQHEPALYAVKDGAEDHWRFEPEHELNSYAVKKGATGHWSGSRKQSSVWFVEHIKSETGHSTQKPVECMRRPILNNSAPGEAIYEPFSGSGTTIIAAEMTGRACHAIELSPAYVDVAIARWQAFTGATSVLEGQPGGTFLELSGQRSSAA